MKLTNKIVSLGRGGHFNVIAEILSALNLDVSLFVTKSSSGRNEISDDDLISMDPKRVTLLNSIGFMPFNENRMKIFQKFKKLNFKFMKIISESAYVSESASIGEGVQALFHATVMANCNIGDNTILNNKSHIDHDVTIGKDNHVAPGAIICGNVRTGNNVFIGAGSVILPNINIGDNSVIEAGAKVSKDLKPNMLYKIDQTVEEIKNT